MSIIIVILILSYLGLDFAPPAFAEVPETEAPKDGDSPQTKVLLPPSSTTSESNKEKQSLEEQKASFFLKAFGKKIPETYHPHDMNVVLDDNFTIQMVVDVNPYTQALQFRTSSIMYFFEKHLLKKRLRRLLGEKRPKTLNEEELKQYGFEIKTEMKYQMIYITSPIELRKKIDIFLSSRPKAIPYQPKKDQPISGYINTNHALSMDLGNYNYNGTYNSNIHIQDWVFQTDTKYIKGVEENSISTTGRIVRDLLEERVRLTFGDNRSPNTRTSPERMPIASGFQEALFGVDISHAGLMARQGTKNKDFSYPMTVVSRSRVEIEINGNRVYNEIVYAGKYVLQGFPFQTGKNDITIRIISNDGTVQENFLEFFHNPSLLPKGKSEYQFITGLPYKDESDITQLNDTQLTNLAYFRYGLSDRIGLTGYMQAVRDNVIVGSMSEYAFSANVLSLELAHSRNSQDQMGQAIRFSGFSSNASIQRQKLNILPSYYTLNVNYTSLHFNQNMYNPGITRNILRTVVAPAMVWQLTNCCQVQFSAIIRDYRTQIDSHALELRAFYRSKDIQFDTTLEKSFGTDNDVFNFFTNLTWRMGRKRRNRFNYRYAHNTSEHNLTANLLPEDSNTMNYQFNSRFINPENYAYDALFRYQNIVHTLATRYNRSINADNESDNFEIDYDGSRALLDISHSRRSTWSTQTSVNLATSVAFVGKHWGFSRPITDSFAILYPNNEGMKNGSITFSNGSFLDRFSPAVYPFLRSYQSQELQIDSVDMPLGLDLGPQQFILESRLNTGQAIPVGKPGGIIMASAILLRPNGKPFDLEVGTFTYVDDPELTVRFFTNRKGKLFVQGLKSGTYSMQFLNEEYANLTVEIPKDAKSPFKLGSFTLQLAE